MSWVLFVLVLLIVFRCCVRAFVLFGVLVVVFYVRVLCCCYLDDFVFVCVLCVLFVFVRSVIVLHSFSGRLKLLFVFCCFIVFFSLLMCVGLFLRLHRFRTRMMLSL